MPDPRLPFWHKVSEFTEKYERSPGYFEIKSGDQIYRSIWDDHGYKWVTWEPYDVVDHYSRIPGNDLSIKWVPKFGRSIRG